MDRREKLAAVERKKLFSPWDLIVAVVIVAVGIGVFFLVPHAAGRYAEVYSDGRLVLTVELSRDAEYTVSYGAGENRLKVSGGGIEVTGSTCADKVCQHFGRIEKQGQEIVCLPNRLVVRIRGDKSDLDGVTG